MDKYKKNILKYGAAILLFGIFIFLFWYSYNYYNMRQNSQINMASVIQSFKSDVISYDFSSVSLGAKAAYVYDITNKKLLFEKNDQAQLPLASVGKVALVLLAEKYLPKNALIPINLTALQTEGDSGLHIGTSWYKQSLIDFTLMMSSNDGAVALGEAITEKTNVPTVSLLNTFAQVLGMDQTYFINDTGLDSNNFLSGVYSSAKDVAVLFTYAYITNAQILNATTYPAKRYYDSNKNSYLGINTNKVLSELPGLVFGKTGFTDLAGGNVAIVIESEPGHAFVLVVLGSTEEGRFSDMRSLVRVIMHNRNE